MNERMSDMGTETEAGGIRISHVRSDGTEASTEAFDMIGPAETTAEITAEMTNITSEIAGIWEASGPEAAARSIAWLRDQLKNNPDQVEDGWGAEARALEGFDQQAYDRETTGQMGLPTSGDEGDEIEAEAADEADEIRDIELDEIEERRAEQQAERDAGVITRGESYDFDRHGGASI